jgi:hypothetical protein
VDTSTLKTVVYLEGDQFWPGDSQRKEVLDPAGGNAPVATGALREVDNHTPSHESTLPSLRPHRSGTASGTPFTYLPLSGTATCSGVNLAKPAKTEKQLRYPNIIE